jgi:hypothetical protein
MVGWLVDWFGKWLIDWQITRIFLAEVPSFVFNVAALVLKYFFILIFLQWKIVGGFIVGWFTDWLAESPLVHWLIADSWQNELLIDRHKKHRIFLSEAPVREQQHNFLFKWLIDWLIDWVRYWLSGWLLVFFFQKFRSKEAQNNSRTEQGKESSSALHFSHRYLFLYC